MTLSWWSSPSPDVEMRESAPSRGRRAVAAHRRDLRRPMAVVAEMSKGDIPKNLYQLDDLLARSRRPSALRSSIARRRTRSKLLLLRQRALDAIGSVA